MQGTDAEGLEVAAQCLSEVFGLNTARAENGIQLRSLVELFTLGHGSVPPPGGISISSAGHPPTSTSNVVPSQLHAESSVSFG